MLLTQENVQLLESEIDRMTAELPVVRSFILPAGSEKVALSHVCRTVTRRLERRMVELGDSYEGSELCLQFVNRLSDYFFILSKKLAQNDECEIFLWEK